MMSDGRAWMKSLKTVKKSDEIKKPSDKKIDKGDDKKITRDACDDCHDSSGEVYDD